MPLTEAETKQIIQEYMNAKVVYRDNCKERHKGVDKLEKKVNSMDNRLWLILVGLLGNFLALISGVVLIVKFLG